MQMRALFVLSAVCSAAAQTQPQTPKCTDVYPHLSCGLRHDDAASCQAAGCCWGEGGSDAASDGGNCFAPAIFGYEYTATVEEPGIQQGTLTLNEGSGIAFGEDYSQLDIKVTQETKDRTHIKISVPGVDRWEVPEDLLPRPGGVFTGVASTQTHIVPQADDDPYDNMEILINRMDGLKPTAELIFIFTKMLVFQEQYIQFVLGSPPDTMATFGLGESSRLTQHLGANLTYTLWNSDMPASNFGQDLYGSHPFFVQVSASGDAHGVLFLSSNAMDVTLTDSEDSGSTIAFQSTGGLVDIYVFAGPTPGDVIQQYLEVVGLPALPPYWSLGFHNCRWGYPNTEYIREVVRNYSAASIPMETQWADIDYMDKYEDFTVDPVSFGGLHNLVDDLHANGQRFVPIIDPAIFAGDTDYEAFQQGLIQDIFVKDLNGKDPYLGQVWPGPTFFPDWFAANTTSYWAAELASFYALVKFDGIWIDMNEVSNFCNYNGHGQVCKERENAQCLKNVCCLECSTVDERNSYDFPPFVPHTVMKTLGGRTLPMSALHAGSILEYNAHNLHGMMESKATSSAVSHILSERPFVLSRSTFLGSGKYAAHWTGDNAATWDDLAVSIVTMNNMALFGVPMLGADICGFQDDTTEELCGRWIQVGAFSPFSRAHNIRKTEPQELYRWDSVAAISRTVLTLRYQLLPYLYTLMYTAHAQGKMVHNAMWVNFPADANTLYQDKQFMWSDAILFTPVVIEGANVVTGYFPASLWYSLFDDSMIDTSAQGQYITLNTPFNATNAHIRGGSIVPMQDFAMTTKEVSASPFTLLIALDSNNEASGNLFLDDGLQVDLTKVAVLDYTVADNTLKASVHADTYSTDLHLGTVSVLAPRAHGGVAFGSTCLGSVSSGTGATLASAAGTVTAFNNYYRVDFKFATTDVKIVSDFVFSWDGC
jgi:alpha-glucosidase (family GH31 glycosyl hydrolase)